MTESHALSNSANARSTQSIRLLASIRHTDSIRNSPSTRRMRKQLGGPERCQAAHPGNVGFYAKVLAAFGSQILAGHDGVSAATQSVADDPVRNRKPDPTLQAPCRRIVEERRRVVHQVNENLSSPQSGVQRGLITGEQRLGWIRRARIEVGSGVLAMRLRVPTSFQFHHVRVV